MVSPAFPILIIAPTSASEAVLFSGLARRLVDEIEHARFTVVGPAEVLGLYRDVPGLERLIPSPTGLGWARLWLRLRRRRWGLVLDLQGGRLGRSLKARRRALRKPSLSAGAPLHKVEEAGRILRLEDDPPPPFLFAGPRTEAEAAGLLRGDPAAPILALAPAADWVGKAWPAERFAVVAAELLSPRGPLCGGRLMVVGAAEDRWASETVRRAIPRERLIDLSNGPDLLTTYACLKKARLFIGADTVFTHLAAAAGAPTLGLFGPTDERVWRPWGAQAQALRGPRDLDAIRAVDPRLNQAVCHMQDLPTAWVINAARRLIEASGTPPQTEGAVDG